MNLKKDKKWLIITLLIYIAILLINKNSFFYSYQESSYFNQNEIKLTYYSRDDMESPHLLKVENEEKEINFLNVTMCSRLSTNTVLSIYTQSDDGDFIPVTTFKYPVLRKTQMIPIQSNVYSSIYIGTDQPDLIKEVTLGNRVFMPVQLNFKWILSQIIAFFSAAIISYIVCWINRKTEHRTSAQKQKALRSSNIEFLRILCMFLLIAHHCVVHGGAVTMTDSTNQLVSYAFLTVGKICFIIYIAISMWFFVDQSFKFERFVKTWLEVFFYSVTFTIISFFLGANISFIDLISSCFPIIGNSYGFAASYLLFYLFLPFIQRVTSTLNKLQSRYLLFLLFIAQIISQLMGSVTNYYQPLFSEITLFVFCYVLMFNLKKWPLDILKDKRILTGIFMGIWILLVQCNYTTIWGTDNKIIDFILNNSGSESSLLIIIAGYACFFIVKDIPLKYNKIINTLSKYTFAVLLIHDHNFFRGIIWNRFIETGTWYYSSYFILYLFITCCTVFFVCSVIDYLRQSVLEKPLLLNPKLQDLFQKINTKIISSEIENEPKKN